MTDCTTLNIESQIQKMKNATRRSSTLILNFHKEFLERYPNGRVNKDQFINEIVYKLIDEDDSIDECKSEKQSLCERLFAVCDKDEDNKVDFVEVSIHLIIV
jgi:hypothetical protein